MLTRTRTELVTKIKSKISLFTYIHFNKQITDAFKKNFTQNLNFFNPTIQERYRISPNPANIKQRKRLLIRAERRAAEGKFEAGLTLGPNPRTARTKENRVRAPCREREKKQEQNQLARGKSQAQQRDLQKNRAGNAESGGRIKIQTGTSPERGKNDLRTPRAGADGWWQKSSGRHHRNRPVLSKT
jgi:hypothetical protein